MQQIAGLNEPSSYNEWLFSTLTQEQIQQILYLQSPSIEVINTIIGGTNQFATMDDFMEGYKKYQIDKKLQCNPGRIYNLKLTGFQTCRMPVSKGGRKVRF